MPLQRWIRAVCSYCGESFTYAAAHGWSHTGRSNQTKDTECPGNPIIMESELRVYDFDSPNYHIFGGTIMTEREKHLLKEQEKRDRKRKTKKRVFRNLIS